MKHQKRQRMMMAVLAGIMAVLMLLPISHWINGICVAVIVLTTIYSGVEYFMKNLDMIAQAK